jgi:DNA-binding transcriptional MocR family regulator
LQDTGREQRLVSLRELYSGRRDAFVRKLVAGFSDLATWQIPLGGLFFWLRLNRQINLKRVLDEALKLNVAFMPGDYFFSSEVRDSYIRLNFSHANEDEAERGLAILAKLIRKALPY